MDLHVTSPTTDLFFISRRACDNVSLHIFDFLFFLFKNCFCNLHSIQKFVVRASVARGQGSGLSAQTKILLVFGMLRIPISQNHMLSCDQPSRGSDFLPSEEPAVMSHLTFQLSHLDFPGNCSFQNI